MKFGLDGRDSESSGLCGSTFRGNAGLQRDCAAGGVFAFLFSAYIWHFVRCFFGRIYRNRRLTIAGRRLSATDEKVIDIALKAGYESPESFTRAFTKFHGISPSNARKDGTKLKSYSRLSVQVIMKGGCMMDYKLMKKQSFKVLEKVERHSIADDENKNTIPEFWGRAKQDGTMDTLLACAADKTYVFGICYGNQMTDSQTFDYSIAVLCDENCIAPEGYRITEIPARTWAIFSCVGAMPEAIQNTWHRICSEFFPASEYVPTYEMDMEVYTDGDMCAPDYKSEIWVPVKQ